MKENVRHENKIKWGETVQQKELRKRLAQSNEGR
jgi:hypothetical protein